MTQPTPQLDPKLRQAYDRVMGTAPASTLNPTTAPTQSTISTATTTQKSPIGNVTIPIMPDMQKTPPISEEHIAATAKTLEPTTPKMVTPTSPMSNAAYAGQGVAATMSTHATTEPVQKNTPHVDSKTHGYVAPKKNQTISPVVIVVAVVAFMLIYGVFWIKFFGLKIPFISQ